MLVWRQVGTAKRGSFGKLFDLMVEMHQKYNWPHTVRIYKSHTGLQDQVIVEAECESLAEFEEAGKQWSEYWSKVDHPSLNEHLETRGRTEFLTVATIPAQT